MCDTHSVVMPTLGKKSYPLCLDCLKKLLQLQCNELAITGDRGHVWL